MTIYYVMIEGVPKETNPESEETQGAYIDVWVKTESLEDAIQKGSQAKLSIMARSRAVSA